MECKLPMLPRVDGAEHLLTELRTALAGHFARMEKESVEDLCVSNIIRRPYSTVLFLTVKTDRHTRKLVAKRIVHHPENKAVSARENQAVVEFNILQHLYARFEPMPGCSVCRPVVVLPALETVVIEFVEGTLLADELGRARYLSSRSGFAQLQALFHQCGRWLSHFQEFTKAQPSGPEIVDGILQRCDFRLGLIEAAHDPRCPDHLRSRVMRRLHQQRRSLEGAYIRAAGRHGDFGPWNILCGPDGITVLDFFSYQEEPLPVDPLQMLMALEREKACLTTNARRIEALKECFVDGYGNLSGVQEPLVYLCESLQRICTVQGCVTPRGGWFHKRIERSRCVRSNLEWLTADTPPSSLWPRSQRRSLAASAVL